MDFAPLEHHLEIAEAVDRVCRGFDDTYWSTCDQEHRFPWEFYRAMAEGGWIGIAIPEQYGGGGQGIAEAALVLNRVAASGAAMNGSSALHLTMFGLNPVVKFGNEQLKETFLPRAARGDLHVAFGVTEPDAGTDTSRITTRAVPDGAGGWRVRGRKIWTSKAMEAEVVLLLVRTDGFDARGPVAAPRLRRPTASRASPCSSPISTGATATSGPSRSSVATPWRRARWPTTTCPWRAGGWSASKGAASTTSCTG